MADVNANIHIGIDATQALGQLRALQNQISQFNRSVASGNAAAAATQASMASSLASMVGATGQFNTSIRTMESGVASLGTAFDKGTLSGRQFFRYAASQMPGLTRAFKSLGVEQAQMAELATDRVKRLQTQYVDLGKDIRGMQRVMAIQPKTLASGYATDLALAQQKQQLFNRALQMGSNSMVNWGKNTQWSGRQLMVGFTVPLTIAAGAAAKFYMELDKASMQFRRVYGDLNTSTEETYRNLEAIRALGVEYTKYGTAVKDVIDIGARVAATGATNEDLLAGTEQTLRLATLGQMEYGNALSAVTSLQTAFAISSEDLGNKINFLNAVENQTVLTMEDMALAVPRVAPVIKGLGGDVEDLAVFMTALREGGVSAEQGANALKSGLASLINPTTRAQETLQALGININQIVQANKGDLMGTVKAFGDALNSLGEFERQQALETVFGKYQYARLGALFKNISNDASQSARAMELAGSSIEELRGMAEKELAIVSETVTSQFLGAVERLKVAIAPVGEIFLKAITPVIDAVSKIANAFNELPDGVKTAIGAVVGIVGGIAPVFLMGIGLIGNAIGNGLKFILALRNGVKGLAAIVGGSAADFKFQSGAALDAAAAMASLEGRVSGLTGDLLMQEGAVASLTAAYRSLAGAASAAAASMPRGFAMPGMMAGRGGFRAPTVTTQGFNRGGVVPGSGNRDTIPAMLTPGESVVTKEATQKYGPVIQAMNAGTLPGFQYGAYSIGVPGGKAISFQAKETQTMNAIVQRIEGFLSRDSQLNDESRRNLANALRAQVKESASGRLSVDRLVATVRSQGLEISSRPLRTDAPSSLSAAGPEARVAKQVAARIKELDPFAEEKRLIRQTFGGRLTEGQISNLTNVQAAHLEPKRLPSGQKDFSDPSILRAELGATNNYLNRMRASLEAIDDPMRQTISRQQLAADIQQRTNMSLDSVNRELDNLRRGIAPVTEQARRVAVSFATIDQELSAAAMAQGRVGDKDRTALGTVPARGYQAEAFRLTEESLVRRGAYASGGIASSTFQDLGRQYGLITGEAEKTGTAAATATRSAYAAGTAGMGAAAMEAATPGAVAGATRIGSQSGIQTGRAYTAAVESSTQDVYLISRDRNSPHPMVAADARSDAQIYSSTFKATVGTINVPVQAQPTGTRPQVSAAGFADANISTNVPRGKAIPVRQRLAIESAEGRDRRIAAQETRKQIKDTRAGAAALRNDTAAVKQLTQTRKETTKLLGQGAVQETAERLARQKATEQLRASVKESVVANAGRTAAARESRAAVLAETQNQRPATGGKLAGAVGAARRLMFPAGQGGSLRNMGFDPYSGMQNQRQLAGQLVRQTGTAITGNVTALGSIAANEIKKAGSAIAEAGKAAANQVKTAGSRVADSLKTGVAERVTSIGNSIRNAPQTIIDSAKSAGGGVAGFFRRPDIIDEESGKVIGKGQSRFGRMTGGQGGAMGAGMALGMGSMIPFMMQDDQGKFMGVDANVAGMGMMGAGGLLSMIGMVPGPLLAVAAGAAAAAGAIAIWRTSVDDSARAAADFGANIGGAANALTNMANMLGKATPTQQAAQLQLGLTQEDAEMAFGEFQSMMNTEAGQQFIQKLESATSADRFTMLGDYVSAAIASGLMDTKTGQAFAKTIAASMNDPVLGNSVSRALAKQETGAKAMLDLAEKRLTAVQETEGIKTVSGRGEGPLKGYAAGRAGSFLGFEDASQVIGSSIQVMRDFSEAAAMAELEYKNGTISFAEYQAVIQQNSAVQEEYANYMRKAITLSNDTGAVSQALKSQIMALGVTEEEFGQIEESTAMSAQDIKDAGIQVAAGVNVAGTRLADAVSAVASGMNPADVAAIMNFTKDLSTQAGQFYAQNMGEQGAVQTAGFIMAAETGQIAGAETPEERQRVIDVGINFTGNIADLQAFLAAVPEEKVMTVVTKLESLSPQQQQAYINSFQRLSTAVGQEAATAITESPEYQAALEKARGKALSPKGTRRGPGDERELKRIEESVTSAQEAGVFSDLESVITFVLKEEPSDIASRLPELTRLAEEINENIPPEIQKMIGIDINNPEDLDKFAPMAEDLGILIPMLDKIPEDAKELAISMMITKSGKPAKPEDFAKDMTKLNKIYSDLESTDFEVKKKAIVSLIQEFRGPSGDPISEAQAQNVFQDLVNRFGESKIANLPPDAINKLIKLSLRVQGLKEQIDFYKTLGSLGGEAAGLANKRIAQLTLLLNKARAAQTGVVEGGNISGGGGSTGGGGGGGGGGGESEKSGAELIEEMMDDLNLQLKFLGNYKKKGDEVVSGLAQALRNAGAPEKLIADIISKGKDGIKIAQKLLADKAKELKKLTSKMLEVTRLTFVETQRAAAVNFRVQGSALRSLLGAGIGATAAMDIASDPEQAQMINATFRQLQQAEQAYDSAKGNRKKKAKKDLEEAKDAWNQLTGSIKATTKAEQQYNYEIARGQIAEQTKSLGIQSAAMTRLMRRGFNFEQAQEFSQDEVLAGALVSAGRAADAAARRVAYLQKQLEKTKEGSKEWKRLNKELKQAQREADITSKKYRALIADLKNLTEEQKKNLVTNTTEEYKGLTGELQMQIDILAKLQAAGMSYAQAIEIASDPQRALAFAAALEQGGDAFKNMVAQAIALEKATAAFSIQVKLAEFGDEIRKEAMRGDVMGLTKNNPLGGMVTDYLMGMSYAELEAFFALPPEKQKEFVDRLLESIPPAERIKYLFEQISAQQKYQSTLNRDKANLAKGDIDNLDDQLKAQRKLLDAEQDKLKAVQKTIDAIQEENDDLNRGLELISRQEEKINEAFDQRIEALDKVEQANARIAQQQQNQLNLSQALSSGDIYAATQAAQQIRQDNAAAAIENTREALEVAREEQLKNLAVEVNGQLLTREQIEKRIEGNNDRIYQLQESQVEVIQASIDAIQDQIDKIEDLKTAWQDYFDWLEKNSKITISGVEFTYEELSDIGRRFNEIMALPGMTAEKAFEQLVADLKTAGKALTDKELGALKTYFGIGTTVTPPPPPADGDADAATAPGEEEEDGGATTKDINAAKEAAILALPEVQKVLDVVKLIWPEINKWEDAILIFAQTIEDTVHPIMDKTKTKTGAILSKFKDLGAFLVDELIPNSLNPFKEFLEKDLLTAANNILTAFMNINGQIVGAITNVGSLVSSLNSLERNIVINVVVNTTYTSSGSPAPTNPGKPKKFTGGLIKMATGGMIPGGVPRDSVPILASPGEFVVRNAMVDKYGIPMLNNINQGSFEPSFKTPSGVSYTKINKPTEINTNRTMYNNNYSINVTANTNANADEIASATVMKIRQMDSMRIRGARG